MQFEDNTRTRNHYKGVLKYHLIISTKYRRKCLNQIEDIVYESFRYAEQKSKMKILNMKLDQDHIHFLIQIPPTVSIGSIIGRMKQQSTWYLKENETSYSWLRNFYWSKKFQIWTHGYFVSTVGDVSEKIVFEYIEKQGMK